MKIEIKDKQILINGQPELIMSGEIHYFRLNKDEWQDRITKLKEAGCNTVATYIPWICHNPIEGVMDLDGHTRPELDLESFITLCAKNDLMCFLRPGPFIMAEVKNEGIPSWIYTKYPEIIPVGWNDRAATTPTLDYLSPNFLIEVKKWYDAVIPIISRHLCTKGGNVIALQLDNEIGMLSWVSNVPDLTDYVLTEFSAWLKMKYSKEVLVSRYPFSLEDFKEYSKAFRAPTEIYALSLLKDLGYYMRHRFAIYIKTLREYAEENGVKDIPFVVNIHGTGGGRGFTYPIGISQLYESYTQDIGYLSGSDIYFGNLTMDNFQDLYICNAFMAAVNREEQPLSSVEFECGDGNYGSTFGARYDVSASDLKTRMCIAQGNRLLNYYLMAGGKNYRFNEIDLKDGNNRVAFTGERHGFAAPISPEGELNYTYPRMKRVIKTMMANKEKLAAMNEVYDKLVLAFIPDYFMTEYHYPMSEKSKDLKMNLEKHRGYSAWETVARAALLLNQRFTAYDIQNKEIDFNKTLLVFSASYMSTQIQQKLADYLNKGGNLFLYGEVPIYDMEQNPCTILAGALGIKEINNIEGQQHYYLSVYGDGMMSDRPETRITYAQTYEISEGEALLRVYGTDAITSFKKSIGLGKCLVLSGNYNTDLEFFKRCFDYLEASPELSHDCSHHGIFMTTNQNISNEQYLHILNLDGFNKSFHVFHKGKSLFDGNKVHLNHKDGLLLPINITVNNICINYSTAEIIEIKDDELTFRLNHEEDVISLTTDRMIIECEEYLIKEQGAYKIITPVKPVVPDKELIIKFS